jgi:capsular polysaccharide biosynthesis protein
MGFMVRPLPTFYQSTDFAFENNRILGRNPAAKRIVLGGPDTDLRDYVASYFECTSVERSGVLRGEYIFDFSGLALWRRDGSAFKINLSWEDHYGSQKVDDYYSSPEFQIRKKKYINEWEQIPVFDDIVILSHAYISNYFHFTMELVTKLRHFPAARAHNMAIPSAGVAKPFQRNLLWELGAGRTLLSVGDRIRVRNPMLADGVMSDESITWFRQNLPVKIGRGRRNIYIRRGAKNTRAGAGGDLAPTAEFQQFLQDHHFEILSFGDGELDVRQQAGLLHGVRTILSAHGAALTNIVHLDPAVHVIEIISPITPRAMFMHMAATLGLSYHGIACELVDADHNILVARSDLEHAMSTAA